MPATIRLPSVDLSRGSGPETDMKVLKARLGDGYEQVAADGLNPIVRRFRCVWRAISESDADDLVAFFDARGGHEPFLSPDPAPPGMGTDRQWRCERYVGPTWVSATLRDMEAELVEDFTP
ncbi:MAG: phage tail protein [Holophagales bacterium]|nr:phage tail protein [Holophagales bacterium]MYC11884.1 phage tail protein [Holophagales bacterium]